VLASVIQGDADDCNSVACLVFPFSLLWPTLLTCSSHASMTATSLSFLEVFGLPTLFSLNYLANWYQESSQARWCACHARLGFGTLSLCLLFSLHLFSSFCCFFHATHVIHPAPQGGVCYREPLKRVQPGCVRTPSVWEAWIVTSSMLNSRLTNRPKRALTSMCMEVTYKCRLLGLSLLLALADFAHM